MLKSTLNSRAAPGFKTRATKFASQQSLREGAFTYCVDKSKYVYGRQVVLNMSTECRFSFIIVKEFLLQCQPGQGRGRQVVNNGQNIVNVVKERTLSQKPRFDTKFGFGAEHVFQILHVFIQHFPGICSRFVVTRL